jgi:hypothetical protein
VLLARRREEVLVDPPLERRFLQEAPDDVVIAGQVRGDHLEGNGPLQLELYGPIHDAHTAVTDDRVDPVPGEDGSDREPAHRLAIILHLARVDEHSTFSARAVPPGRSLRFRELAHL